jgi:adenylosuccinate synthase
MPISIVVGGQYGSEGKGKVAHLLARDQSVRIAVRVGGCNSGHTSLSGPAGRMVLRQLPTAALEPDVICVLAAGSYIDPVILLEEIKQVHLPLDRLWIDPNAMIIKAEDRDVERSSGLTTRIGSTGSGTGAAVMRRIQRRSTGDLVAASAELASCIRPTRPLLVDALSSSQRVLIEGTQGFGLSILHTPHFPNATARDTTAAGALSEVGLSPLDVDEVVLVLRAFPIRVAGDSGPFGEEEIDWETVRREGGHSHDLTEYTSVTRKVRRVARFDAAIVRAAIAANNPSRIVLNHVDHVDAGARHGLTNKAQAFVARVSSGIERPIDMIGLSPDVLVPSGPRLTVAVGNP